MEEKSIWSSVQQKPMKLIMFNNNFKIIEQPLLFFISLADVTVINACRVAQIFLFLFAWKPEEISNQIGNIFQSIFIAVINCILAPIFFSQVAATLIHETIKYVAIDLLYDSIIKPIATVISNEIKSNRKQGEKLLNQDLNSTQLNDKQDEGLLNLDPNSIQPDIKQNKRLNSLGENKTGEGRGFLDQGDVKKEEPRKPQGRLPPIKEDKKPSIVNNNINNFGLNYRG